MAYWIYKCNSRARSYQRAWGDWDDVFAQQAATEWGSTEHVPELSKARRGDVVLAYQTDRNEPVGIAEVVALRRRGAHRDLILRPTEGLRVKVRPLKERTQAIARIPALKPGPVRTLYPISRSDAGRLLGAAKAQYRPALSAAAEEAEEAIATGGGFGSAEENRKVEQAAVRYVRDYLRRYGWKVRDVSAERCGYDLECRRGHSVLHIEVKGTRGPDQQFILTPNGLSTWKRDKRFRLALVTDALSRPKPLHFRGPNALKGIDLEPIAYVCVPRPSA